jgi:hypothetical protein
VPGRVVGLTGGFVVTRTSERILAGWRDQRIGTLLTVRPTTTIADLELG